MLALASVKSRPFASSVLAANSPTTRFNESWPTGQSPRLLGGAIYPTRKSPMTMSAGGIVNLFPFIDEFSPQWELFRVISSENRVKLPEKEYLFPTLRGK